MAKNSLSCLMSCAFAYLHVLCVKNVLHGVCQLKVSELYNGSTGRLDMRYGVVVFSLNIMFKK